MEFLRSFLRLHFAGKPVVVSLNVGSFLRLLKDQTVSVPFLLNEIETIWIRFLVAEFRYQKSVKPIEEYDIIKSLRLSSIKYSACSSFAALSGNSDLKLHSTIQDKEVENELEEENEMEKGNAKVVKNSAAKGPGEKVEEKEGNAKCELEDEVDDIEPINHFLKVKTHLLRFILLLFHQLAHLCYTHISTEHHDLVFLLRAW